MGQALTGGRTRVRRLPDKQVDDVAARDALLDAALVAHVGAGVDGQPFVLPLAVADRPDSPDRPGAPEAMQHRCLVVLGACEVLESDAAERGLEVLTEHLLPGRAEARRPSRRELAATRLLALPLREWSLKVSDGGPEDDPADLALPVWAGAVPLRHVWGEPVPAADLAPGLPVPGHVRAWPAGRT